MTIISFMTLPENKKGVLLMNSLSFRKPYD